MAQVNTFNAQARLNKLVAIEQNGFTPTPIEVIEWIKSNPHAAMQLAIASHGVNWYGCNCELHKLGIEQFGECNSQAENHGYKIEEKD